MPGYNFFVSNSVVSEDKIIIRNLRGQVVRPRGVLTLSVGVLEFVFIFLADFSLVALSLDFRFGDFPVTGN